MVSVRQVMVLRYASFKPRLTTTPLRFASPSPPSGWTGDFHLRAAEHARHTIKNRRAAVITDRSAGHILVKIVRR